MATTRADPFAVIETAAPEFDNATVASIVREHFGLDARLKPLLGERDQNFRLQCADGSEFVLKIANAAEDREATDFQIQALLYLESWLAEHACPIVVPKIVPTRCGKSHVLVEWNAQVHVARIVTFVPGVPLGDAPLSDRLCRRLGGYLAYLGQALRDFQHPASSHGLLWDMQQALEMRKIVNFIGDPQLEEAVSRTLDDFESHALPRFADLRTQVIHSDLNPDNVMIAPDDADEVTGVIDFGDMVRAPLIVDVAIGASYMRAVSGNPLLHIADFVAGYHAVTPLERSEIDLLLDLIRARLAASIAILAWRASMRGPDDPYLAGTNAIESGAAMFLGILDQMPRDETRRTLRQVCAAV